MDCLHRSNPLVESSSPIFEIEQCEKATIKKIQMLVNPQLFPDWSGATSLIKDPFEEAINLAKQAVSADPNFSPALSTYGYTIGINGKMEGIDYLIPLNRKMKPLHGLREHINK